MIRTREITPADSAVISKISRRCLYIEVSPRKERSTSISVTRDFLSELSQRHPNVAIDTLDLWNTELPEFSGATIDAKYAKLTGTPMSADQASAWQSIGHMVDRLKDADSVVIATPMWNFGIPYKLKHWIDLITQPGLTFAFDPATGYTPLLRARPTLVVLSSAGDYANGPSRGRPDLATPYLEAALKFIGLDAINVVRVGPTVGPAEDVAAAKASAQRALSRLATSFMEQVQ